MTSPYATYAAKMALVADEAEALADDMRAAKGIAPDAEGMTADTINAAFDNDAEAMMAIADAAREASRVAYEQVPADAKFAAAPTESDVSDAYKAAEDAKERGAAPEEIRKARNHAADLAAEREDAKKEHAAVSRRSTESFAAIKVADVPLLDVPIPQVRRGESYNGRRAASPGVGGQETTPSTSGNGNSNGGGMPLDSSSSNGGSALSDSDAGTSLSAYGSGAPMNAQQLAGQPQQMPQQGAMGGQPQMSPMGQAGAVPTTGAGNLSTGTASRGRGKDKDKRRNDNGTPIVPAMAPMSFGNASSGGAVDRGSSTSGVTTAANTSGSLKTALSAASVPPGTGQAPGMMAHRGMGGMMGGAPGAGGAGGTTKERPTIYDANRPDEVERSDSVKDGTLSRATAEDPNVAEERERAK